MKIYILSSFACTYMDGWGSDYEGLINELVTADLEEIKERLFGNANEINSELLTVWEKGEKKQDIEVRYLGATYEEEVEVRKWIDRMIAEEKEYATLDWDNSEEEIGKVETQGFDIGERVRVRSIVEKQTGQTVQREGVIVEKEEGSSARYIVEYTNGERAFRQARVLERI